MTSGPGGQPSLRDLTGYGEHPPPVSWPNGAKVAVSVVVHFQEGAESSIGSGDAVDEDITVFGGWGSDPSRRNLMKESYTEYGSRVGIWRVLSLLRRHGITATVMACGKALEESPEVAAAIVRDGHEVGAHGYRWAGTVGMDRAEELEEIRRCTASIERTTGVRPVGWYVRDGITENTRSLLKSEGYLYDSNSFADDLPYFVPVESGSHLVVPYASDTNDMRFWDGGTLATGNEFFEVCRDSLEFLLDEDDEVGRMMSVGIHSRIGGRPSIARGIQQFLQYAGERDGVWFASREQIARWWINAANHSGSSNKETRRL